MRHSIAGSIVLQRPSGAASAATVMSVPPVPDRGPGSTTPSGKADPRATRAQPVWVSGDLDARTVPVLLPQVDRMVRGSTGTVALDLSRVSFMDVAGVFMLLEVQERLLARGRMLALRATPSVVLSVLAYVGCAEMFVTVPGPRARC